jgi:UDP-N-acetylmuramoylalanine--D-glutamate ligase
LNIFLQKKILIYGLGKSGLSTFEFLKNKSRVFIYDDFKSKIYNPNVKKKIISYQKVINFNFDRIIISPGIDVNKCKLSNFLKKNYDKVFTDLDIFYSFFKNKCITVTGTNGKSTTSQLLYEVLLDQRYDVKLAGNIGTPILSIKKIKKKTLFIIEASSYQLDYSKIFKSKYAIILNLSPDHIERHKSIRKYILAKFKLIKSQSKSDLAFVKKDDVLIKKELRSGKFSSKIIKVDTRKNNFLSNINNDYFTTETNKENLSFVFEISKKLKLNQYLLEQTIQKFQGLKYRQQIIFKNKNLTIINDSKSTSFSSTVGLLKRKSHIFWLIGGVYKKGDKFTLKKKYFRNIRAFIYGKNKKYFNKSLKGKVKCENFRNLSEALKKVFALIKFQKSFNQTILFSPCAASFDSFKNFEERGLYFNNLVKKYLNGSQKINI